MDKASVRAILETQPNDVNVDAFLEQLVLRQKIEGGEADIEAGRVVSNDEAKKRLGTC